MLFGLLVLACHLEREVESTVHGGGAKRIVETSVHAHSPRSQNEQSGHDIHDRPLVSIEPGKEPSSRGDCHGTDERCYLEGHRHELQAVGGQESDGHDQELFGRWVQSEEQVST